MAEQKHQLTFHQRREWKHELRFFYVNCVEIKKSKESLEMENPNLQVNIDKMLHRGIFFSIFWLLGIGSLIAITAAVKARRIIVQSDGEITGMGKVWWCFIVGGIGLFFWLFVFLKVIFNSLAG